MGTKWKCFNRPREADMHRTQWSPSHPLATTLNLYSSSALVLNVSMSLKCALYLPVC